AGPGLTRPQRWGRRSGTANADPTCHRNFKPSVFNAISACRRQRGRHHETTPPLRAEIEMARTELSNAMRRLNRLDEELEEVRATVKQLWMKILELERDL